MPKDGIYIAHKSEDGMRTQTVAEHLRGVADRCAEFASPFDFDFDTAKLAELTGLVHDIGKYSEAFQRRIRGEAIKVDHSTAGAYECYNRRLAAPALAVAGHHGGLPDWKIDNGGLRSRIERAQKGEIEPCERWLEEIKLPNDVTERLPDDRFEQDFFIRMIYSCLVDADWLDTEYFMNDGLVTRGGYDSLDRLRERLSAYVADRGWDRPDTPIDRARRDIMSRCSEVGREGKRGVYSLTVPTGGGKTTASLEFAIEHARANGLKRIFYIIPYTSIIDQNAKVFRDILGQNNVLEHHSGVVYRDKTREMADETDALEAVMAKSTENWDMPVVVTTAVQFFDSLFAARGPQCRKLHNLADSVVIFDEAQMMPFEKLRPCVAAIAELVKHYRATAVLCTATQPSLDGLFKERIPGIEIREICPEGTYDISVFERVTYRDIGTVAEAELADMLSDKDQVLCVVNTRKAAREIYSSLKGEGAYHLSTLMYPKHRRAVIDEIKERLAKGLPCRVVSTSLIEAGVDISFPAVFREINSIDSIVQAAGRCNRGGKADAESSVVSVFRLEGKSYLRMSSVAPANKVLEQFDRPDSREAIACYFGELMGLRGKESMDTKGIMRFISDNPPSLRSVSEKFSLIDSDTVTVYIPTAENAELIAGLEAGERSFRLFRELAAYGVSVYREQLRELYDGGHVRQLDDIEAAVLTTTGKYSCETGLDTDPDLGQTITI